jgi:hypothetical protein
VIVQYTPTYKLDALLLQWYARLLQDGELATMLVDRLHPASSFLRFFQPPTLLRLDVVETIRAAMWFSPLLDGAVVGLYVCPEWRHLRRGTMFTVEGLQWGLSRWPVLVGWTRNARRVRTYRRFGFQLGGSIPNAQGGQTVWMVTLTAEQLARRVERMARHATMADAH